MFGTIEWIWVISSLIGVVIAARSAIRLGTSVISRTLWVMSIGFLVFASAPIVGAFVVSPSNLFGILTTVAIVIFMLGIVRFTCHTSMNKSH